MHRFKNIRVDESEAFNFNTRPVIVSVTGGDNCTKARLFYVYPYVLQSSSEYFRNLIIDIGDKHEHRIEVKATSGHTFGLYLHSLYFGTFPCRSDDDDSGSSTEYADLFELYIFADFVKDVKVMDASIGAIMSKSMETRPARLPDAEAVTLAYQNLSYGSPLQRLAVDIYVWFSDGTYFDQGWEDANADFGLDLARTLLKKTATSRLQQAVPAEVSICNYHNPGDCEECESKKRKRAE